MQENLLNMLIKFINVVWSDLNLKKTIMFSHVKSEKGSVKCQSCKLIGKEDNWLNEINSYKINVCKQRQTLGS